MIYHFKKIANFSTRPFLQEMLKNLSKDIFSLLMKAYTQVKRSFQNFVVSI